MTAVPTGSEQAAAVTVRAGIVGVGTAGGRVVTRLARDWPDGPRWVAVNTDVREWEETPSVVSVPIGARVMKGLGTGGDPRVGRRAAETDLAAVREALADLDLVFVLVGLGGGAGTGAAPVIVEEARRAGALTLVFAVLPFAFEGRRRAEVAERGLTALRETADGVVCLPNQRLVGSLESRANMVEAFQRSDAVLGRGVQAIWRMVCRRDVIPVDFSHVRRLLQGARGTCVFGCVEGEGPGRVARMLEAARHEPLLGGETGLRRATAALVSVIGGPDLTLREEAELLQGVAALLPEQALTMVGVGLEPAWRDTVRLTILSVEPETRRADTPSRAPEADGAAEGGVGESGVPPAAARGKAGAESGRKARPVQPSLFETVATGQGRFKDVAPTIVEGENLDIPTYVRRGVPIQKARSLTDAS